MQQSVKTDRIDQLNKLRSDLVVRIGNIYVDDIASNANLRFSFHDTQTLLSNLFARDPPGLGRLDPP